MSDHYNTLILGSGEAGKYIGWALGSAGKRVACIERQWLGGSCPNTACLPSKNYIHSANVIHEAAKAAQDGLFTADTSSIKMSVVKQRKQEMVDGLKVMHEGRFKDSGLELIKGYGRFAGAKEIMVDLLDGGTRTLTADTIVVCTGSRTKIPEVQGLVSAKPLTHIELLELDVVPPHLAILGGGYIALEFAQCMRRLGSQVTIITHSSRILPREDTDVSSTLTTILENEGIRIHVSTSITLVQGRSGDSVSLFGSNKSSSSQVEMTATHLLIATGRVPNTSDLSLEKAGIATIATGHIAVDEHLRSTSAKDVYAVGDCAGSPHFTHVAYDDHRIVLSALHSSTTGGSRTTTGRQVPYTLFTSPELARVGLSEDEAKVKGVEYRLAKLPMAAFLKTRTLGQTDGFAKVLIGTDDKILGFAALGPGAGELLPVLQLAMRAGLGWQSIADLILTHPTMGEGLTFLFKGVPIA